MLGPLCEKKKKHSLTSPASTAIFRGLNNGFNAGRGWAKTALAGSVSWARLDAFLRLPDNEDHRDRNVSQIAFTDAAVAWPAAKSTSAGEEERFVLRGLNGELPAGGLTIVAGKTGTGKSLLLNAILGEADIVSGKLGVPGPPADADAIECPERAPRPGQDWLVPHATAYVSQTPWIDNDTVRENILFGTVFDRARFDAVIGACELRYDLDVMMPDGEETEIGINGINLSGGQRWRVALARALYSRAGILVLDDIFSAVDTHVGRAILDHALGGPLCKGRTVIVATHHVSLAMAKADHVLVISDQQVVYSGPVNDDNRSSVLAQVLEAEGGDDGVESDESGGESSDDGRSGKFAKKTGNGETTNNDSDDATLAPSPEGTNATTPVVAATPWTAAAATTAATTAERPTSSSDSVATLTLVARGTPKKYVTDEFRASGAVSGKVYASYFRHTGGWRFCIVALVLFAAVQVADIERVWWLKVWTANSSLGDATHDTRYYVGVYVGIVVLVFVLVGVRSVFIFWASIRASNRFFGQFNSAVLHAPLRWMDTTPPGRILNRYSGDFAAIDSDLAECLNKSGHVMVLMLVLIIVTLAAAPPVVIVFIPLALQFVYYGTGFLAIVQPTRRLHSVTRSYLTQRLVSTVQAASTIRAFGRSRMLLAHASDEIDDWNTAGLHHFMSLRWYGLRGDVLSACLTVSVTIYLTIMGNTPAAFAGFVLSSVSGLDHAMYWSLRALADVEQCMVAAERIMEYADMKVEFQAGKQVAAAWPERGRIEVNGLVAAYAPEMPPVLRGVSFAAESGERIGVVGRTGAGKSSLALALLRALDVRRGAIFIDGVDIASIRVRVLRSRITIIPQVSCRRGGHLAVTALTATSALFGTPSIHWHMLTLFPPGPHSLLRHRAQQHRPPQPPHRRRAPRRPLPSASRARAVSRHGRGGRRHDALARPAPAAPSCARPTHAPARAHPRRGHVGRRRRHRRPHPGHHPARFRWGHSGRDCAPHRHRRRL
jgi:ABC-type multidrug transport system fused ATPase/permease subunit